MSEASLEELRTIQTRQGARFGEYSGSATPLSFVNAEEEDSAVRERAGLFDLTWLRVLEITGPDRAGFLHNMTTNHVLGLAPGGWQRSTTCDATGHVLGVFRLANAGEAFWLDLHPGCSESVAANLERHLIMEEVEIAEMHSAWGILSLQGPRSLDALGQVMGQPLSLASHEIRTIQWAGVRAYLIWSDHTSHPGADVLAPREQLPLFWDALVAALGPLDGKPAGFETLNRFRIEAGIPWWNEDIDPSMLMLESGLGDAIHYDKGCYLGQETLARIHFRGHTNREITRLEFGTEAMPERGAGLLLSDKEVGKVTSATRSVRDGRVTGLGLVRREALEPGTRLQLENSTAVIVTGGPAAAGG